MRSLARSARRQPAPLVGVLIALIAAAALVTMIAGLAGSSAHARVPVHRLAGAQAVLVGDQHVRFVTGSGDDQDTETEPLTTYRRVPTALADRLAAVAGVARAVPDVSVPLRLVGAPGGGSALAATAHGWASAAITPFHLVSGHEPVEATDIVLGAGLARSLGVRPGGRLATLGLDGPPLTVVGLVEAAPGARSGPGPGPDPADGTVFLTDAAAAARYGHPGQADLVAVLAAPSAGQTSADRRGLAARLRSVAKTAAPGAAVLTGSARGQAEDVQAAGEGTDMTDFAFGAGVPVALIALFVVAGAAGRSVASRRRGYALLRAIGATPGQVRRAVAGEMAVLGVVGGLLGYPVGLLASDRLVSGLVGHDLLPAGTASWSAPWVIAVAVGSGVVVAEISGFVAGRRAGRISPVRALGEAATDRRWPHPLRLLLGVVALGGGITLLTLGFQSTMSPDDQANLALGALLTLMVSIGLLAPLFVALGEAVVRVPAARLGGAGARLALADIRYRSGRIVSAVVAVSLSTGFLGAVYLVNAAVPHADTAQTARRLVADSVITAPGGLAPGAIGALGRTPGVTAAVGVSFTPVFLPVGGGGSFAGAAVWGDAGTTVPETGAVVDLDVRAGSLRDLRPGTIALSRLAAGHRRVGSTVRGFLADGTPYPARVVAVFDRGLGFADVVVPAGAAGGGHVGPGRLDEVLVRGHPAAGSLAALAGRFPGLATQDRIAANAEAKRMDNENSYLNNVIVLMIAALVAVTVVTTLVTGTLERAGTLRLLGRVGAGEAQLLAMAGWQALMVTVLGLVAGIATGGATVIAITKAITGDFHPYVPAGPAFGLVATVAVLTLAATAGPTALVARGRDRPAA